MPKNKCVFKDAWLKNDCYSDWLEKESKDRAKCRLCLHSFDIGNMGESALKSHIKGKKHQNAIAQFKQTPSALIWRKPSTSGSSTTSAPAPNVNAEKNQNVSNFVMKEDILKAEIKWTLRTVEKNLSFKSNDDIGEFLRYTFPNNPVIEKFSCGENKASYLANFGIAPYFSECLLKEVGEHEYVVLFDESLNKVTQTKQMDVHIRIWDVNGIATRYLTSTFMGHSTADDVLSHFRQATEKLNYKHLLQVSMDGPNTNLKFHKMLTEYLEDKNLSIIDIGTCGLHTVHNAIKDAVKATTWDLETFFSHSFYLFDDSPARREDFLSVTSSSKIPIRFCRHRWLENIPVGERVIECLPHLISYVNAVSVKKVNQPKNKAFEIVKEYISDKLLLAKLEFYLSISRQVNFFLQHYQTDNCVIPFLGEDMFNMLKCIMDRVFEHEEINVSLENSEKLFQNHKARSPNQVDIGFGAEDEVKKVKATKQISERDEYQFRSECKAALLKLGNRLKAKSPLRHELVRNLDCLNPKKVLNDREKNLAKFTKVLNELRDARKMTSAECDIAKNQYSEFLDDALLNPDDYRLFDIKEEKVDMFLLEKLSKDKFSTLWKCVRMLLLLSHGQASVERGFSINKQVIDDNMGEKTLVSRRIIRDAIERAGGLAKIPITKSLIFAASNSRIKYRDYLEKEAKAKEKEKESNKRKALLEEISELKSKRMRLVKDADVLEKSSGKFVEQAEDAKGSQQMRHLIVKANSHLRTSREKLSEAESLDAEIKSKLDKVKEMC